MESHSSEEQKSKNEEDDYEAESIYIKIKKEKPNMIYLEKKIYEKIILQIEKYNTIIKEIKSKSFNSQTCLGLIPNTNNNTKNEKIEKILQEKEKTINELRNEIGLKEKEITSLRNQNEQINKKYDELKNKYNKEIEEKNIIINSIKEDLNNINNKYNDLIEKINKEKNKEDKTNFLIKILTNEKISDIIMKYLTFEESLKLFSVNKAINLTFKYKNKYHKFFKYIV
jgi:chromosome segregation ATPase